MFKTLEEAQIWIENIKRFGSKLDLKRMEKAVEILGHPEKSFKSIHVGGTNGKGSTSTYLKKILTEAGFKVGIYTSPYVVKFNERIGIGDEYISDEDLIHYANILYPLTEEMLEEDETVTFFEVLTLMAFLYFRDQKVEYGIIEVGLGGLLDATNVIIPEISVITNISYDHMKQLGNSLESIAINKLGIVKENISLVTSVENETLMPLFYEVTHNKNSLIKFVEFDKIANISVKETTSFTYKDKDYILNLTGFHQVKNACLAIEVIKLLAEVNDLVITEDNIYQGLNKAFWPGRFEIFNKNIVIDGAHNIGGIQALISSVKSVYSGKYIKCLFSVMRDKEHKKIIEELDNFCDELYFTEFEYQRRADAEELFLESSHYHKSFHKDYKQIFNQLCQELKTDEVLIITGSLYFISEIRKLLVK